MRNIMLLFCCIACFSAANAQEGRYFEVIPKANSANSLVFCPEVASQKDIWENGNVMLDDIFEDGPIFPSLERSLPQPSSRCPLPFGLREKFEAAICFEIKEESIVSVQILDLEGELMQVPVPAWLLSPGSHSWTLEVALPAGTWRFQVVAGDKLLQEGELSAL